MSSFALTYHKNDNDNDNNNNRLLTDPKKKLGSCSISFLVHPGRSPGTDVVMPERSLDI